VTVDGARLFQMLPHVLRERDAGAQGALRDLVEVLAEQLGVVEDDLLQLYDDLFIETCDDWVIPYIGALVGVGGLHPETEAGKRARAEVAHTLGYRRRKGTAGVLQDLARDVTGWPALAREERFHLVSTQHLDHVRPDHPGTPDLRDMARMHRVGTPFERVTRTVEVRRAADGGKANLPNLSLYLWRLLALPIHEAPATRIGPGRWVVSPLGHDAPLFHAPSAPGVSPLGFLDLPQALPRWALREALQGPLPRVYGRGPAGERLSFGLWVNGVEIPRARVHACDLSDDPGNPGAWARVPQADYAIDPVLGRIALPVNVPDLDAAPAEVRVFYFYGAAAELGGGEYARAERFTELPTRWQVAQRAPWVHTEIRARFPLPAGESGAVQVEDSERYAETPRIELGADQRVELRAANQRRPHLALGGDLVVTGLAGAEVTLNGLLISGGRVLVPQNAALARLRLVDCTLVPGRDLTRAGEPANPAAESLAVFQPDLEVELIRCVVGRLQVARGSQVKAQDSIIDATASDRMAFSGPNGEVGGDLALEACTVIGTVRAGRLDASNCVLHASHPAEPPVLAERRQQGCLRFSYVPPGSVVPRTHACVPTGAEDTVPRPEFVSTRYGQPAYGLLAPATPAAIQSGADDESEMGALHHQFAPQRLANLALRLDEYLRFSLEAGVSFARAPEME
jgi:hypothetical protein